MDDSVLLGRPYGGCGIIYRKALAPLVSHLPSTSKRFCALKFSLNGISLLFICVYFPTDYRDAQSRAAFAWLRDTRLDEIDFSTVQQTFDYREVTLMLIFLAKASCLYKIRDQSMRQHY